MLFSVIIPTRNRPEFLPAAVVSVLRQQCADLELLVINDGSLGIPDFQDSRIRVLSSHEAGAVQARRLGVTQARGSAIAFLDDDDQWTDDLWLATAAGTLAQGAQFVFGDGALVCPDNTRRLFAQNADADSLMRDNTILISSVCYLKQLHQQLGAFDESLPYYWDWDWYIRVARSGAVIQRIARPVVDIRIHAQNMSGNRNENQRRDNLALLSAKHGMGQIPLKSHMDFV